ncbi:909_t:CDS:1, partial [Acaulospora morrowiae]
MYTAQVPRNNLDVHLEWMRGLGTKRREYFPTANEARPIAPIKSTSDKWQSIKSRDQDSFNAVQPSNSLSTVTNLDSSLNNETNMCLDDDLFCNGKEPKRNMERFRSRDSGVSLGCDITPNSTVHERFTNNSATEPPVGSCIDTAIDLDDNSNLMCEDDLLCDYELFSEEELRMLLDEENSKREAELQKNIYSQNGRQVPQTEKLSTLDLGSDFTKLENINLLVDFWQENNQDLEKMSYNELNECRNLANSIRYKAADELAELWSSGKGDDHRFKLLTEKRDSCKARIEAIESRLKAFGSTNFMGQGSNGDHFTAAYSSTHETSLETRSSYFNNFQVTNTCRADTSSSFNCSNNTMPEPVASVPTPEIMDHVDPDIFNVLRRDFKLENFRYKQLEAITATLNGEDVFMLMPTGG